MTTNDDRLTFDDITQLAVEELYNQKAIYHRNMFHCVCDVLVHRDDRYAHAVTCCELREYVIATHVGEP